MSKTQKRTLEGDGEEKQVVEIGLYVTVQLLDYWGNWTERQYIAVDKFMGNWVICEHWYSTASDGTKISQLGVPLIVKSERIRIHPDKANRPLPWDWYKSPEDMVRFFKGRVDGISEYRSLEKTEISAYGS